MPKRPVTAKARRVGDGTRRGELDLLRAQVVVGLVFFYLRFWYVRPSLGFPFVITPSRTRLGEPQSHAIPLRRNLCAGEP